MILDIFYFKGKYQLVSKNITPIFFILISIEYLIEGQYYIFLFVGTLSLFALLIGNGAFSKMKNKDNEQL